mmetsp:Transcript_30439/g.79184  ORF Transcript_30439/g.79184 Transcript_30439/m.79184 type:complete len:204 (-) Transcript_30439:176-787(-)
MQHLTAILQATQLKNHTLGQVLELAQPAPKVPTKQQAAFHCQQAIQMERIFSYSGAGACSLQSPLPDPVTQHSTSFQPTCFSNMILSASKHGWQRLAIKELHSLNCRCSAATAVAATPAARGLLLLLQAEGRGTSHILQVLLLQVQVLLLQAEGRDPLQVLQVLLLQVQVLLLQVEGRDPLQVCWGGVGRQWLLPSRRRWGRS